MPEIVIYTQSWCPYCSRAKNLLERKGVAFREIKAPHGTPERKESIQRSGGQTSVPQIFINDRYVGGCDAACGAGRRRSSSIPCCSAA